MFFFCTYFEIEYRSISDDTVQLQDKLPFGFGINSDGEYGYIKVGADTVTPFKINTDDFLVKNIKDFSTSFRANGSGSMDVSNPPLTPVACGIISLYAPGGSSGARLPVSASISLSGTVCTYSYSMYNGSLTVSISFRVIYI